MAHPDEFPQNGMQLPWSKKSGREPIIGHFARDHGALVPDRLITSAKSWLSNFHIDPKKPVLPWKSDIKEQKLSAFECSRRYLEHMREGFLSMLNPLEAILGIWPKDKSCSPFRRRSMKLPGP